MKQDLPPVVTEEELLEGIDLLRKTWGLTKRNVN